MDLRQIEHGHEVDHGSCVLFLLAEPARQEVSTDFLVDGGRLRHFGDWFPAHARCRFPGHVPHHVDALSWRQGRGALTEQRSRPWQQTSKDLHKLTATNVPQTFHRTFLLENPWNLYITTSFTTPSSSLAIKSASFELSWLSTVRKLASISHVAQTKQTSKVIFSSDSTLKCLYWREHPYRKRMRTTITETRPVVFLPDTSP